MTLLVSYDIADDRLRQKAANKLLEYGFLRLQKSVFAGVPSEGLWHSCQQWLQAHLAPAFGPEDRLFYLPLTEGQAKNFVFLPATPTEWNDLLQPPSTLFI